MAEVRSISSTGGEKGVKPEEYALIPWEAMDEIARVYAFGARKYSAHNWRKGYEWGKSFSALCRHLFAFWRGEDRDPESGLSHVAHAGFHVLTLLSFWLDRERYARFDDRYADADEERKFKEPGGDRHRVSVRDLISPYDDAPPPPAPLPLAPPPPKRWARRYLG